MSLRHITVGGEQVEVHVSDFGYVPSLGPDQRWLAHISGSGRYACGATPEAALQAYKQVLLDDIVTPDNPALESKS